jgi:hypothetical protein
MGRIMALLVRPDWRDLLTARPALPARITPNWRGMKDVYRWIFLLTLATASSCITVLSDGSPTAVTARIGGSEDVR